MCFYTWYNLMILDMEDCYIILDMTSFPTIFRCLTTKFVTLEITTSEI